MRIKQYTLILLLLPQMQIYKMPTFSSRALLALVKYFFIATFLTTTACTVRLFFIQLLQALQPSYYLVDVWPTFIFKYLLIYIKSLLVISLKAQIQLSFYSIPLYLSKIRCQYSTTTALKLYTVYLQISILISLLLADSLPFQAVTLLKYYLSFHRGTI